MKTRISNKGKLSNCCQAWVRVEPKLDLINPLGKTFYYVCTNCGRACDTN